MKGQVTTCCIAALLGLLSVGCVINHPQDSGSSQTSVSIPNEAPRKLVINRYQLVPSSFSVSPGQYYSAQFNVSGNGRVVGNYRSDSNIIVYIFDQEGFQTYAAKDVNGKGSMYYNSGGQVASGQLDVNLRGGTYHIVFANTYSIISTKHITANIDLEN